MVTRENVGESCHGVLNLLLDGGKEWSRDNLLVKERANSVESYFYRI